MQWWRLKILKNKLNGTLNAQNALLVCFPEKLQNRCLENLLFRAPNRIGCTIVPKQKLNLNQWALFPHNLRQFPIHFDKIQTKRTANLYVLIQAVLETYTKHQSEVIEVENFGELVAWRISEFFEIILKMEIDDLTKLINQFKQNNLDINHELQVLKIELVDVEGSAISIPYNKLYLKEQTLKYSYSTNHWKKFVSEIKELYSKVHDLTKPLIKIENGTTYRELKEVKKEQHKNKTDDCKKVFKIKSQPTESSIDQTSTQIKKKTPDCNLTAQTRRESKNTLEVNDSHRRPKTERRKKLVKQHKHQSEPVIKPNQIPKDEKSVPPSTSEKPQNHPNDVQIKSAKPPNVLVYADSPITKDNVKRVLHSILNRDKYTIYDLPANTVSWNGSTVLVVVCGTVPPNLTSNLIQFFLNGGQLLCLCSDLMYSILHTFTTAEVREHELVRFSYGAWEQVKMMHHIFCYQASPAKKQFSKDSDSANNSDGSSPVAPRTPSNVELKHNDKDYNISVEILGTEETWHTPSLLLAKVKGTQGRAVFSQVHLEIDPSEYENDEDKYKSLQSSNEARIEILKDILSKHLDLDSCSNSENIRYSPAYFLGRYESKMQMLSTCDSIKNNKLSTDKINLEFFGNNRDPGEASDIRLPILINSCPTNFSTLEYFENLQTTEIGRLLVYADVLKSSQFLLEKQLAHGFAAIARQQTRGVGRSTNSWLSPIGSANFSLQLHLKTDTPIGRTLSLVQHLVAIGVVSALTQEYKNLDLKIKWPNDIYVNGSVKIGGIVVNCLTNGDLAVVNIGCGLNLSNSEPTMCINDVIGETEKLSAEKYFAIVFNSIENLLKEVQQNGLDELFQLYYKFWLHSNAKVQVQNSKGEIRNSVVNGIDEFGYLKVKLENGKEVALQPDGNTFDMMRGLIAPKVF